jgi:hypothetical protein
MKREKQKKNDKLTIQAYEDSEAEKLAQWISNGTWPFHGIEYPSFDKVMQSISNGFYTGADNQTFWIYLDS